MSYKKFLATAIMLSVLVSPKLFAVNYAQAEAYAGVKLPSDVWTVDRDNDTDAKKMIITNIEKCDPIETHYEHSGDYKTIGKCIHKDDPLKDDHGHLKYNFSMKILLKADKTIGFTLNAEKAECDYKAMAFAGQVTTYYYDVRNCKVDKATITPLTPTSCPKTATVVVNGGDDGITLIPTCE